MYYVGSVAGFILNSQSEKRRKPFKDFLRIGLKNNHQKEKESSIIKNFCSWLTRVVEF